MTGLGHARASSPDAQRTLDAELRAAALVGAGVQADPIDPAGAGRGGYEDGFTIVAGEDGTRLNIGVQTQFRFTANLGAREVGGAGDYEGGFEARRTKVRFAGGLAGGRLTYEVLPAFRRTDGTMFMENVFARYDLRDAWGEGWSVRAGQFRLPLLREEGIGSANQLAADTSVMNGVFNQGFSKAVELEWRRGGLRALGAFSDGLRTQDQNFDGPPNADWALTGRVEWAALGELAGVRTFTSFPGREASLVLGLAGHAQQSENSDDPGDTDRTLLLVTGDAQFAGDGWNAFGALVWRRTLDRAGGGQTEFDDLGAIVQGGLFVHEHAELFARYDLTVPDTGRGGGDDPFHALTLGVNAYPVRRSRAVVGTLDVQWFPSAQADSASIVGPNPGIGLLAGDRDGQVAVRAQVAFTF